MSHFAEQTTIGANATQTFSSYVDRDYMLPWYDLSQPFFVFRRPVNHFFGNVHAQKTISLSQILRF